MPKHTPAYVQERYLRIQTAWAALEPSWILGGLTLDQYKERVGKAEAVRQQLAATEALLAQLQSDRADLDAGLLLDIAYVVNSVRGERALGGANGALYEAMGFVPTTQRRSGLTRRKRKEESNPAA